MRIQGLRFGFVGLLVLFMAMALRASSAPTAVQDSLDRALADERHAFAFYEAVLTKHGERKPFSNIVHAEDRHENALLAQYERLGLTPPANAWADHAFEVPDSFAEACDQSVVAEVRNARMYDELIAACDDEQVRAVFERLKAASVERHLPAFSRHGSGWTGVEEAALTEAQRKQLERATSARDAMYKAVLGELMMGMADGGASGAVEVCSKRAPLIAKEVSESRGVEIGRTSWKLRNQDNAPPTWAALLIDERPEAPKYMANPAGEFGALLPIRVAGTCLQCHGKLEQLDPRVRDQLARLYPEDQATGFASGDLRGWFWVTVGP
ncbi:MAG: DUF3365 domain-containing protein [Phycisphaerales bacterium]|nr:DUF3365 domain-containing protein [Phycisphaerales bacterium]